MPMNTTRAVHEAIAAALNCRLRELANPTRAAPQAAYLKDKVKCFGIPAPVLQAEFKTQKMNLLKDHTADAVAHTGTALVRCEEFEAKYMGILCWSWLVQLKKMDEETVQSILNASENALRDGSVNEWATCDGLAGKVLHFIIKDWPTVAVDRLAIWSQDSSAPWLQRASCVAYVKLAQAKRTARSHKPAAAAELSSASATVPRDLDKGAAPERDMGPHTAQILHNCSHVLRNPDRFCQLGCGWVLRNLTTSHYPGDVTAVYTFIRSNIGIISPEGLRYALEKTDPVLKRDLQSLHRAAHRGAGGAKASVDDVSMSADDANHHPTEARSSKRQRE